MTALGLALIVIGAIITVVSLAGFIWLSAGPQPRYRR